MVKKRRFEEEQVESELAPQHRPEKPVADQSLSAPPLEGVFQQLLTNQVDMGPDIISVWNSPFLLSLAPNEQLQYQANTELYCSLSHSQIAKMTEVSSLCLASLSCVNT